MRHRWSAPPVELSGLKIEVLPRRCLNSVKNCDDRVNLEEITFSLSPSPSCLFFQHLHTQVSVAFQTQERKKKKETNVLAIAIIVRC